MSITLIIDGADRTSLWQINSLQISDELNSRNTCNFKLRVKNEAFRPVVGQEVVILQDTTRIFAGTIDEVEEKQLLGTSVLIFTCYCVDYNQLCDRHLVARVYENQTLGAIVKDIVTQDLAGEGVTTNHVQDGPLITKATFNYRTVAEAFNDLAELTGYAWNIDYNKDLHFFARETYTAPFSISDTSNNVRNMTVRQTREQYRNRQYIRAGQDVTDTRTEQFAGDGKTKTFVLAFPVAKKPTVTVNGVAKTVGIRGLDTGKDFYWSKGEKEITQDDSATPLASTDTLSVTYQGLFPIILASQSDSEISSRASVEGGTGVYEAIEDDQDIDSQTLAMQKANGLLRKYGRIPRIIEFETDTVGLAAGQLITINVSAHNLNGQFLIDSVQAQDIDGLYLRYRVRALDGERLGGWVEFFQKLAQAGRKFVIRENEVLILLRRFSDAVVLSDALTATSTAYVGAEIARSLVQEETTQSDFASGTLTNVVATAAGDLKLQTVANPTFTRSSVAYLSDGTQVAANTPRFEQGRFGKAVMVEEGTTNLVPPDAVNNFNIWKKANHTDSGQTITAPNGVDVPIWQISDEGYIFYDLDAGLFTEGQEYTASIYVYPSHDYIFQLRWCEAYVSQFARANQWTRIVNTVTYDSSRANANRILLGYRDVDGASDPPPDFKVAYAMAQLEAKPYATSFIDGTRAAETLTIPTAGVLNPQEGTVECWVYVPEFWKVGIPHWRRIWGIGRSAGAGMYVLRYDPNTGKMAFGIFNDAGTAQYISVDKPSIGWHYFATKWSASEMALFIDGVKVGYISNPNLPTNFADTVLSIGCRPDSPYDNVNSLIDDLRISSRARTDTEIAAAYASGQPLPVDEWTTYKLNMDNNLIASKLGKRLSPVYDISTVGTAASSTISWNATLPANTSLTVETNLSLDGGATWQGWQVCTNGGAIPGITAGMDLSSARLQVRETLSTPDTTVTPQLHFLLLEILAPWEQKNEVGFSEVA